MLTGQAKDQYYTSGASQAVDFGTACKMVQGFFEGPNYHQENFNEWNRTTLETIITENPEFTPPRGSISTDQAQEEEKKTQGFSDDLVARLKEVQQQQEADLDSKASIEEPQEPQLQLP